MEKLSEIIAKLVKRGARPITVTMRTIPRMNKAGKTTFGEIFKVSVVNGFVNFDYEKSVNRQLGREEKTQDFKAQSNWFNHTDTPGIICHRDDTSKLYLQMKVERAIESAYFDTSGAHINTKQVESFLPARNEPKNQGTDKAIFTITISLDNITSFVCDGKQYCDGKRYGEHKYGFPELENDNNSTYCEACKCRITAGKCKHGIRPPGRLLLPV